MTLPGKVVLCQLEEDNPQKSFFRIKPLFIICHDGLCKLENGKENYPDEGGIRIVPDKNEAGLFRGRMRTMGGYCLLDLTRHTGENDKIRPNKNYSAERGEINRNIVYSDVIAACPELEVMQVVAPVSANESMRVNVDANIYTRLVLTRREGKLAGPFAWEKDETGITLSLYKPNFEADEGYVCRMNRDGEELEMYISSRTPEEKAEQPKAEPAAAKAEEKAEEKAEIKPEAKPEAIPEAANAVAVTEEKPVEATEQKPEAENEVKAEEKPEIKPEAKLKPEVKPEIKPVKKPEIKPEIKPAESAAQRRRAEKELIGQLGLNPRKSKGLCELVDDSWKHTRLEQLGAVVQGDATSKPIVSPIEQAQQVFDEAWKNEDGRAALVKHILNLDLMPQAVKSALGIECDKNGKNAEMEELEAERLALLRDIDKLRSGKAEVKTALLEETLKSHNGEISKLEQQKDKLEKECGSLNRAAQAARAARKDADALLTKETQDKLDSEFLRYAMFTKAAELLRNEPEADLSDFIGSPKTYKPTGAQMVSDLRRSFEDAGLELSHDEALNLLTCIALGKIVIFSGPTGCGKTFLANAVANALGLNNRGACRFAVLNAAESDVRKTAQFKVLSSLKDTSTLRLMLLDDINAVPAADQSRGLMAYTDKKPEGVTVIMTVQDDQLGYPMDSRLLDRAFFIRLKPIKAARWGRSAEVKPAGITAEWSTMKRIFNPDTEVPAEIVSRFEILQSRLEALGTGFSPRAMADMYAFCAAFAPLMAGEPISALDRAVAQRGLPFILATASAQVISQLPSVLCDMPLSLSLLNQPLALPEI